MTNPQEDVNMGHPLHSVAEEGRLQVVKELSKRVDALCQAT